MTRTKLRSLALTCITAATTLLATHTTAQAQQPEPPAEADVVNEKANTIDEWNKSLNIKNTCPANVTIYIPPSGASTPLSNPLLPHFGGVHQQVTLNDYPTNIALTLPYNALWTTGLITYNESRDSGIRSATKALSGVHEQCPNARIHMYGYSEGGDVGAHIVQNISQGRGPIPKQTLGSAVFQGNPVRNTVGTHSAGSAPKGRGLFAPVPYGDQADKVMEVCSAGDVVCNTSNIAPNLYYLYEDYISNSAPLRGKFSLREVIRRATPEIIARSGLEVPKSVVGWILHSTEYYTITRSDRNAGEDFIRAHYADTPETDVPETNTPETNTPETDTPETETPETDVPETNTPETNTPETDTPETETPETDVPETDTPETDVPETNTPETNVAESETSETPEPSHNDNHSTGSRHLASTGASVIGISLGALALIGSGIFLSRRKKA